MNITSIKSGNIAFYIFKALKLTSTMQVASKPKCAPAGPTSARYGTNIADAKLPTHPAHKYIIVIRAVPAIFSKSLMSQYCRSTVRAK